MSEPDPKLIFELYDLMEKRLSELGITFEEFTILYKSFQATISAAGVDTEKATEEQREEAISPFPWAKYAGYGKYS